MDPPHRFWNSEKLGLVAGDGWEVVAALTVVFNINHGPWRTGKWLSELSQAQSEYFAGHDKWETCPLLKAFLSLIARNKGR